MQTQGTLSFILPAHVLAGIVALGCGSVALYAAKGLGLHRRSGKAFVYAMLLMSLSGAAVAVGRAGAAMNIPAGLITAYLVVTGLLTVRPRTERTRRFDRAAMIAGFALGAGAVVSAIVQAVRGNAAFAYPLVMFAGVALGAAAGDRRMIRLDGLQGSERLRRHLWRMCSALFIAAGSFFLGPIRRIPEPLRTPPFRVIPLVILLTMAYWLWRLRRRRQARRVLDVRAPEAI